MRRVHRPDLEGPPAAQGDVTLFKGDRKIDDLHPQKRIYFAQSQMPMTEASIRTSLIGDV
jgi:cytochrome c biogenesis factor